MARFEAAVAAFNDEGIEEFLDLCTADIRLATATGFPGGGAFQGRKPVELYIREFVSNWVEVRYEYEDARLENGAVVHLARWAVRGEAPDSDASAEVFGVATFRGDLIAALELFWTEEEALAHAGRER
ncbi:MAG TPA: nuclear transport factor 2 family protein [Solirubrobacterales bacterium]